MHVTEQPDTLADYTGFQSRVGIDGDSYSSRKMLILSGLQFQSRVGIDGDSYTIRDGGAIAGNIGLFQSRVGIDGDSYDGSGHSVASGTLWICKFQSRVGIDGDSY